MKNRPYDIALFVAIFVFAPNLWAETENAKSSGNVNAEEVAGPAFFEGQEVRPALLVPQEITVSDDAPREVREVAVFNRRFKRSFFGYTFESLREMFSLGFVYTRKPKLDWGNSRRLLILEGDEEGIVTENKGFKDGLGLSVGYSHILVQNIFAGAGFDIWKKSKARKDSRASILPMALYVNAGFFQDINGTDGHFKMFMGTGLASINHEYDFVGVDFDESFGFMYQFGLGVAFHNFFLDLLFRTIKSNYREESDVVGEGNALTSYKKKGQMGLSHPMLRMGIFF